MSKWFWTAVALLAVNVMIVVYEKGITFFTWRLYLAIAVILLLSALLPEIMVILLIALLITNLFKNTSRIRRVIEK